MVPPSANELAPGARIATRAVLAGDSDPLSQQRAWIRDSIGASRRRAFTPSWQLTGLITISTLGAAPTLNGHTTMRDVSFSQTLTEPTAHRIRVAARY